MDRISDIKPSLYLEYLSTCVPMSGERKEGTADIIINGIAAMNAEL